MSVLRIAVIGAGHLGRFHARLAAENPEFELVAVCDPQAEAGQHLAEEVGTRAVSDYTEITGQIDAAIVASPTFTHRDIGMELLSQGKSVLIEKPIAPTAAEAKDLVELADQRGVVLQIGHVERFNPAFTGVETKLRDPKFIEATRLSGYSFRSTDIGVVLDLMIHDLDLVLSLVRSPVVSVEALGISVLGDHEDIANARLHFANGCVAQLTASRVSYEMRRQMQVATTRAFASLDFSTGTTTLVEPREDILRRQLTAQELVNQGAGYWKDRLFSEVLCTNKIESPAINAIDEEQREFASAIRHGTPVRASGHEAFAAVTVAEQILVQIEEHAWDGHPAGRCGAFAMPALPIQPLPKPAQEYRRAG